MLKYRRLYFSVLETREKINLERSCLPGFFISADKMIDISQQEGAYYFPPNQTQNILTSLQKDKGLSEH